ncbi:MAG: hypothetical protein GX891_05390 [Clostridiales bacterium]|nr:hypothetical protein [Clostridiales bacterium]
MTAYILPTFVGLILVYALIKRAKVYDCFIEGTKSGMSLVKDVFPYICSIFICISLFKASGLSSVISKYLAVPLGFLGIPAELTELLIITPLSGSGTIALLENIIETYGADSYVARCASVICGATETVFYVAAVYISQCKSKKMGPTIPIALFSTFMGAVIACALCKVM